MRPEEIERFFAARWSAGFAGVGRSTSSRERLVARPRSASSTATTLGAVPHHDRREGRLGPRLTAPRRRGSCSRHAFETLNLHRIALSVFEFNERAIRSYRSCGSRSRALARGDLCATASVGRDHDEHPRAGVAGPRGAPNGEERQGPRPIEQGAAGSPARADRRSRGSADRGLERTEGRRGASGLRSSMDAKGHAVDNARAGRRPAGRGIRRGRPPANPKTLDLMLADLMVASSGTRARSLVAERRRARSSCARSPASWTTPEPADANGASLGQAFTR